MHESRVWVRCFPFTSNSITLVPGLRAFGLSPGTSTIWPTWTSANWNMPVLLMPQQLGWATTFERYGVRVSRNAIRCALAGLTLLKYLNLPCLCVMHFGYVLRNSQISSFHTQTWLYKGLQGSFGNPCASNSLLYLPALATELNQNSGQSILWCCRARLESVTSSACVVAFLQALLTR